MNYPRPNQMKKKDTHYVSRQPTLRLLINNVKTLQRYAIV